MKNTDNSIHAPSFQPAQTTRNTTSRQQQPIERAFTNMSSPEKYKKKIYAMPDQSNQFDASTDAASTTEPQAQNTQSTTGDEEDLPHKTLPESSIDQAMESKPHSPSKTIFGLPTAPATLRSDRSSASDTQKTKSVRFVLPTTKRTESHKVKRTVGKRFTPIRPQLYQVTRAKAINPSHSWSASSLFLSRS